MAGDFDPFVRFRDPQIADRQIDTLIGLCKGIVADETVNQAEAEALHNWLVANEANVRSHPVTYPLLEQVTEMLRDGHLDLNESAELLATLRLFAGEAQGAGEFITSSDLPLDNPPPVIVFKSRSFLCTGTFAFGTRPKCVAEIEKRGGTYAKSVRRDLDYLVLGNYVTPSWKHETFGTKIEKAMMWRDEREMPLAIVSEEAWLKAGEINC